MKNYFGNDRDRWIHWLSKIMVRKKLNQFMDLIPTEQRVESKQLPGANKQVPLLPTSFYTKMFLHLVKNHQFESLEVLIKSTPKHVTNAETVIQELKAYQDRDNLGSNPHLLESLFILYQQVIQYEQAFYVILKKKDARVFDFLNERTIDFPLSPNLGKLLLIDASKAVNYIMRRYRRHKSLKIVDTCI